MSCCARGAPQGAVEEEEQRPRPEGRPRPGRGCTDVPWLVAFMLFWAGLIFIAAFSIATGAAERLVFGYDSFGNTCGQLNRAIPGVPLSGQDMRSRTYVFFLDACNIDVERARVVSPALCVSQCPQEELPTLSALRLFAHENGSALCTYDLAPAEYTTSPVAHDKCPRLPVPASWLPFFHRCAPSSSSCYAHFLRTLVVFYNQMDAFQRAIEAITANYRAVLALSFLSLGLSLAMLLGLRHLSALLLRILAALLVFSLLMVTGLTWWMYSDHADLLARTAAQPGPALSPDVGSQRDEDGASPVPFALAATPANSSVPQLGILEDNTLALLVGATLSSIATVLLLLLVLLAWRRLHLAVGLFGMLGRVFSHLPLLILQPVWTFVILASFWLCWVVVLLLLGTAGDPVRTAQGFVEFRLIGPIRYMWWYHVLGFVWVTSFVLHCQRMAVSGATISYYFARDKQRLPPYPILSSVWQLFRCHLGTVAKGSLLLPLLALPRCLVMHLLCCLQDKSSACARCLLKSCCCLEGLEKHLRHLHETAYIATAHSGTDFCASALEVFELLSSRPLRIVPLVAQGNLLVFLAKMLVVAVTAFFSILVLNFQPNYHLWVVPLGLVCLLAFLVAGCLLSLLSSVSDALLVCFLLDCRGSSDGGAGRGHDADGEIQKCVSRSIKKLAELDRRRKDSNDARDQAVEEQELRSLGSPSAT
ncbi:choline transporter-like protein 1 isoform X2 [Lampetra fluviatilis]